MSRAGRVVTVALGLMGTGAVVGALCGAVTYPLLMLLVGEPGAIFSRNLGMMVTIAAAVGGVIGSIAAPTVGYTLLRRVPLGEAINWTAAGTIAGATFGEFLAPLSMHGGPHVPGGVTGGILGFVGASLVLRLTLGRPKDDSPAVLPAETRHDIEPR